MPAVPPPEEGLPLADAARLVGVSVPQMRRRVLAGRYPHHRDTRGRIIVDIVSAADAADDLSAPLPLAGPGNGGATLREFVRLSVEVERLRAERTEWNAALAFYRDHQTELTTQLSRLIDQLASAHTVIADLARAVVKDRQTGD